MTRRAPSAGGVLATALLLLGVFLVVATSPDARAASSPQLPATWKDNSAAPRVLGDLIDSARRVATENVFWIGYTFHLRDGVHIGCDDWRGSSISFGADGTRLYLDSEEPRGMPCDGDFGLFLRVEGDGDEAVDVRLMSWRRAARRLDGEVVWAGEFAADDSVAWLRSAVLDEGSDGLRVAGPQVEKTRRHLLSAVAVHDSTDAVGIVLEVLNSSYPQELRESAVFWSAQFGGQEGLVELLALAREDADTEVRKQAIFWLAQVAGERAAEDLAAIAVDDPEAEVQKSAVFALSQIDGGGAIGELIEIVRTHDNREVVKSALFWLGQSGDPRAVELIEEILFGRTR